MLMDISISTVIQSETIFIDKQMLLIIHNKVQTNTLVTQTLLLYTHVKRLLLVNQLLLHILGDTQILSDTNKNNYIHQHITDPL